MNKQNLEDMSEEALNGLRISPREMNSREGRPRSDSITTLNSQTTTTATVSQAAIP